MGELATWLAVVFVLDIHESSGGPPETRELEDLFTIGHQLLDQAGPPRDARDPPRRRD